MSKDLVSAEIVINGLDQDVDVEGYFPSGIISGIWKAGDPISKRPDSKVHDTSGCSIRLQSNMNRDDPFVFDGIVDDFYSVYDSLSALKGRSAGEFELQVSICIQVGNGTIPALTMPVEFVNKLSSLNGSIDIDILIEPYQT